jgi:hypothetical protein
MGLDVLRLGTRAQAASPETRANRAFAVGGLRAVHSVHDSASSSARVFPRSHAGSWQTPSASNVSGSCQPQFGGALSFSGMMPKLESAARARAAAGLPT